MLASSSIALGQGKVIAAGGMESMTNVPYYLSKARGGFGYGHQFATDGILVDGLWDAKYQVHMVIGKADMYISMYVCSCMIGRLRRRNSREIQNRPRRTRRICHSILQKICTSYQSMGNNL